VAPKQTYNTTHPNFATDVEEKVGGVAQVIHTVAETLKSPVHISKVISEAHALTSKEFISYMTVEAMRGASSLSHMYEWGRVGDPTARLWKDTLKGNGAKKQAGFEFLRSKSLVPVAPKLQDVGVQQRHIFVWKAPIMEYGLPVSISPKMAKVLVYLANGSARGGASGNSWIKNGIVYNPGIVEIDRQGNVGHWGAFGRAYTDFYTSGIPELVIQEQLLDALQEIIVRESVEAIKKVNTRQRSKSFSIAQMSIDPTLQAKLLRSMNNRYVYTRGRG